MHFICDTKISGGGVIRRKISTKAPEEGNNEKKVEKYSSTCIITSLRLYPLLNVLNAKQGLLRGRVTRWDHHGT